MGWQNTSESDSRRPRHPGPQRPDGRRPKMLQNCSKLPERRHHADHLLRTKMSTSSGDELNMGHFHCRNRLCMITWTSIAVDELRHVIDHTASVVAHNGRVNDLVQRVQRAATVGARLSPPHLHSRTAGHLHNKSRPP